MAVVAAAPLSAQESSLPVTAQPLTSADEQAIAAHLDPLVDDLEHGDPAKAQRARDLIAAPVRGPASVSFRLYYSGRLDDAIARMVAPTADPWRAGLALSVAGAVATDPMLGVILGALDDPRPAVRLAAARELGTTLEQVDADNDAIQDARLDAALRRAQRALEQEPSVHVAGTLALALAGPETPALQDRALAAMARGFGAWLDARGPAGEPDAEETLLTTINVLRVARMRYVNRQIRGGAPAELTDAVLALARAARAAAGRAVDHADLADRASAVADALTQLAQG
ncbi:MAG: hypothetical protein D6693_09095 [Planctomycetota bacterium]|nr:MAG: hypothetical protein D6693_09095 [Planctomycetota bacterium]